mmetsp:Transcript_49623/g.155371  ORF Transcript_49623/g.155371 Transcript_49623/m.155371 type:complete len:346 (-) Transcript_49623:21-1058(-)
MDTDSLQRAFLSYRSPNTSPRHYRIPSSQTKQGNMPVSASEQEAAQDPIDSDEESDKIYAAAGNSHHTHEALFLVQESLGSKSGIRDQDSHGRERKEEIRRSLPGPVKNDSGYQGVIEVRDSHVSLRGMHLFCSISGDGRLEIFSALSYRDKICPVGVFDLNQTFVGVIQSIPTMFTLSTFTVTSVEDIERNEGDVLYCFNDSPSACLEWVFALTEYGAKTNFALEEVDERDELKRKARGGCRHSQSKSLSPLPRFKRLNLEDIVVSRTESDMSDAGTEESLWIPRSKLEIMDGKAKELEGQVGVPGGGSKEIPVIGRSPSSPCCSTNRRSSSPIAFLTSLFQAS